MMNSTDVTVLVARTYLPFNPLHRRRRKVLRRQLPVYMHVKRPHG
jgi:hypothetical protein